MASSVLEDPDWQDREERERAGWTIVRTEGGPDVPDSQSTGADADLERDMILGELEPDVYDPDDDDIEVVKQGKDAIKSNVEEIVKGADNKSRVNHGCG